MTDREPFDPSDPMDAMSESFRLQVTQMALDAYKATIYRDLSPQDQLRCFIAGTLTGVIGVSLASIDSKGADAMMEYLAECLPIAREMADAVRGPDGKPLLNHHDTKADSWDGLDCSCGGGWKVGHAHGCPEAESATPAPTVIGESGGTAT